MERKKWTKEEFIEETRKRMNPEDPYYFPKLEKRRIWLRKKVNGRKKHGKSKLLRADPSRGIRSR